MGSSRVVTRLTMEEEDRDVVVPSGVVVALQESSGESLELGSQLLKK